MEEIPIAGAQAIVLYSDPRENRWLPVGQSDGFSKVKIFQHLTKNCYRLIGWNTDRMVVINTYIESGMRYEQATPSFHHWNSKNVFYGLSFANLQEAAVFATTMREAISCLATGVVPPQQAQAQMQPERGASPEYAMPCKLSNQCPVTPPVNQAVIYHPASLSSESSLDARYQSSSDDSVPGHRRQPSSSSSGYATLGSQLSTASSLVGLGGSAPPPAPPLPPSLSNTVQPPQPPGLVHRASIPPPPPIRRGPACSQGDSDEEDAGQGGLAAMLRANKNRIGKPQAGAVEVKSGPVQSHTQKAVQNDLQSELAKKIAERKRRTEAAAATAEIVDEVPATIEETKRSGVFEIQRREIKSSVETSVTITDSISARKSCSDSTTVASMTVTKQDLENLKKSIVQEIRKEMQQMKLDIITALRTSKA